MIRFKQFLKEAKKDDRYDDEVEHVLKKHSNIKKTNLTKTNIKHHKNIYGVERKFYDQYLHKDKTSEKNMVHVKVPMHKIRATQYVVAKDKVEQKKNEYKKHGRFLGKPPKGYMYRGNVVLVDGHHRAEAAKQLGHKDFTAHVYKLSRKESE